MSKDLKSYMVSLAIDPQELSDFIADPVKAAERAGLSPQDRAALLSGDQERIFAALTGRAESKKLEHGIQAPTSPQPAVSQSVGVPPWPAAFQPAVYPPLWPQSSAGPWGQFGWVRRG